MIDDATLLDGAASVWAVMTFAADLPTTPEQKEALGRARVLFLERAQTLGVTEIAIRNYLNDRAPGSCVGGSPRLRGLPPQQT